MAESINNEQEPISNPAGQAVHSGEHQFWHNVWQVIKTIQARLRFIAILIAIGLLIGYWDTLSNYYEKWTRPSATAGTVSTDFEYFCPMHPFIVRDNAKQNCPICHMDLAKRKKGTDKAEALPPGTVSRVQLTPYRMVLAGVQTSEVTYQRLTKQIATFGSVEFNETKLAHIAARQKGRIVKMHVNFTNQFVKKGDELAVLDVRYSPELIVSLEDLLRARKAGSKEVEAMALKRLSTWNINDKQIDEFLKGGKVNTQLTIYSPIEGHVTKKYQKEGNYVDEGAPLYDVADLDTVWIEAQVYESDQELLQVGQPVSATTLGLPNQAFEGTLKFVYPHLDENSRTLLVRFDIPNRDHKLRPGMYATVKVQVPPLRNSALVQGLLEDTAKENTAIGMYSPAGSLELAPLLTGRYAMLEQGLVLAVPDSAVIDTGAMKIVYRQSAPDVFDGVEVQLGPRMTQPGKSAVFYPVIHGLQAGDQVVINGAFLIDAETRLNPAAGSIYFGGSGGKSSQSAASVRPSTPENDDAKERKIKAELVKLSPQDRQLAAEQKFCPIQKTTRLGSMGPPFKLILDDQPVFLCCQSCEEKAKAKGKETVAAVDALRNRKGVVQKPGPAISEPVDKEEVEIMANLAGLSQEDRRLAQAQKYCPISGDRLGNPAMGVPVKVTINQQPVFLCCKGCEDEARRHADTTLSKIKELSTKGKGNK